MAEYKSQQIGRSSISDILQLLKGFSSGGEPTRMESNIFQEFTAGAGLINNEDLQFNYNRMKSYYDKNIDSMSDDEVEAYGLLDERYKNQMQKNTRFEVDIARRGEFTEGMINFADEYSRLTTDPNARDFTYTTSEIVDGKMTDVEHDVYLPNPEDYDGGTENLEYKKLYDKKLKEYGGVEGFNQKRQDYLDYLGNEMQRQIGSFSDYVGGLVKDYQGTGRLTKWHEGELQELNETYSFIINSFKDNGVIDSDERDAYESALLQSSSAPITEFIAKDAEMKKIRRNATTNEIQSLLKSGEEYTKDLAISNKIQLLGGQLEDNQLELSAFTIPKNSDFNPTDTDKTWTYRDVLDYYSNNETDANLSSYLSSLPQLKIQAEKELKIKDDNLIKNDGVSYLSGLEEDSWAGGLYDDKTDRRFAYTPEAPTEPVVIKEPEKLIDIEKQTKDNIISKQQEEKTEGNVIEIDYSDKSNVQPVKNGVFIKKEDGEQIFVKTEQLAEYQNPTIIDYNSFIQSLMSKENRPDYKKGFPVGGDIETFISLYNPKLKGKLKPMIFKMWSLLDKNKNKEADVIGQRILKLIENTEIKYPE